MTDAHSVPPRHQDVALPLDTTGGIADRRRAAEQSSSEPPTLRSITRRPPSALSLLNQQGQTLMLAAQQLALSAEQIGTPPGGVEATEQPQSSSPSRGNSLSHRTLPLPAHRMPGLDPDGRQGSRTRDRALAPWSARARGEPTQPARRGARCPPRNGPRPPSGQPGRGRTH